jgi:ABC-type spermidine/putrescine transport system permease subunit I
MTVLVAARQRLGRPAGRRLFSLQSVFVAIPLAFFAFAFVLPLVAVAAMAVSEEGLSGVVSVFGRNLFLVAIRQTFEIAVAVTLICLALGLVYAVALTIAGRAVRIFLWGALVGSVVISLVARTYGWILLLRPGGLVTQAVSAVVPGGGEVQILGTTTAVYIGMVHVMLPFMVLPIYTSLQRIPGAHLRAAQTLGSGPWSVLRRVVLPQLRTGMIAGITLVFLMSFGFFVTPALLGGPSDFMVSTLVQMYFGQQFDYGAASAVGTWVVILVMSLYVMADFVFDISARWGRT